jgi:hypothetical protein
MSIHGDPRLLVAHWADEATRAAANTETAQARRHRSEDANAAKQRAEELRGPSESPLRRAWRRLRPQG